MGERRLKGLVLSSAAICGKIDGLAPHRRAIIELITSELVLRGSPMLKALLASTNVAVENIHLECARAYGFEICVSALEGGPCNTAWRGVASKAVYECGEILHTAFSDAGVAPELLRVLVNQAPEEAAPSRSAKQAFVDNSTIVKALRAKGHDKQLVLQSERLLTEDPMNPGSALRRR